MVEFIRQTEKLIKSLGDSTKEKIATAYLEQMQFEGLRDATLKSRMLSAVPFLKRVSNLKSITKDDVRKYVNTLKEQGVKPNTLRLRVINLKKFLEYQGSPDLLEGFKPPKVKTRLPVDNVLKPEDVLELVKHTKTQRDRALIMFLWDSAARVNELTALKLKNLEFDEHGGYVILPNCASGLKTGQRKIRLIDSIPDLTILKNMHPQRENPNAPLFTSYLGTPLSDRRITTIVKNARAKSGIKKDVSPHKFRHARLTFLATVLTEVEMRLYAGWEDDSPMPAVYCRLSARDVEKKMLKMAGVEVEETRIEKRGLAPVPCPRCKQQNAPDALFCNCGQVLDVSVAVKLEDTKVVLNQVEQDKAIIIQQVELMKKMMAKMEAMEQKVAELKIKV